MAGLSIGSSPGHRSAPALRTSTMRWFKRLLAFAFRSRQPLDTALWLYVRCNRCGEAIQVRVDRRYDLASEWRDPGESGPAYSMHKDIVGTSCFQRISVDVGFDSSFQIVEQRIHGGAFLTEEAYRHMTTHEV
jgi:hypothetical protein